MQLPALIHSLLLPNSLFTINCDGKMSFLTQGGPLSGLSSRGVGRTHVIIYSVRKRSIKKCGKPCISSSAAPQHDQQRSMAEVEQEFKSIPKYHDRNQLKLGEQSRAAERFKWSKFQPIPPKGADLRLLCSRVVTANSLALVYSMAG